MSLSNLRKLPIKSVVLLGPTGIGKSSLSIDLCTKHFPDQFEVISSDSVQVYKYFNIGTGKLSKDEMRGVSHYLLDEVFPNENFDVFSFVNSAMNYCKMIIDSGKIPLFVGGTGMYLDAVFQGMSVIPECPQEIRSELVNRAESDGLQVLYEQLCDVDPQTAIQVESSDRQRIIRALEVYLSTGAPISYFRNNKKQFFTGEVLYLGLDCERQILYNSINNRVDKMFSGGLIDEVRTILDMGYSCQCKPFGSIGYKEALMGLDGKISLEDAIYLVKRSTRKYAKKQLTWFKRNNNIQWFEPGSLKAIVAEIQKFILKSR